MEVQPFTATDNRSLACPPGSSVRRKVTHSKMGALLPGPAGDALKSLASVADVLDVMTECTGVMLQALSHEGAPDM